jgi:hypothetical protein
MGGYEMPVKIRGKADPMLEEIKTALTAYVRRHADAQIVLYRRNPVSIRVRIIDPSFAKLERDARNRRAWRYLRKASDEAQSDISMLVLLAPDETELSHANLEFEHPSRSRL